MVKSKLPVQSISVLRVAGHNTIVVSDAKMEKKRGRLPAVAVTEPPQPFTRPLGVATSSPTRVSVKVRALWAGFPAPLVMVSVSWSGEFTCAVGVANALESVVPTTLRVLESVLAVSPPVSSVILPALVFG